MVILVSIVCIAATLGIASGIGWILRHLRERDERENERLRLFEEINSDLKQIING
jgi:uncharacterized protein (DUF1015 family)